LRETANTVVYKINLCTGISIQLQTFKKKK
jgi:hypothetical protein